MAVQIEPRLYTVEEYFEMAQSEEYENQRLELIDGEIFIMAGSSSENSEIGILIGHFFLVFVLPRKLGRVTGADGSYKVGPNTALVPDAAFVSIARAPKWVGNVFDGAPDLAVEVISPSETRRKVLKKVRRYLEAGAHMVWAVYPLEKFVEIYRLDEDRQLKLEVVDIDGVLDGGEVLPIHIISEGHFPRVKE